MNFTKYLLQRPFNIYLLNIPQLSPSIELKQKPHFPDQLQLPRYPIYTFVQAGKKKLPRIFSRLIYASLQTLHVLPITVRHRYMYIAVQVGIRTTSVIVHTKALQLHLQS